MTEAELQSEMTARFEAWVERLCRDPRKIPPTLSRALERCDGEPLAREMVIAFLTYELRGDKQAEGEIPMDLNR